MEGSYKFNVGDFVEIVEDGWGLNRSLLKTIVQITEKGIYEGVYRRPGYKIFPKYGNSASGFMGGFIAQPSFQRTLRAILHEWIRR